MQASGAGLGLAIRFPRGRQRFGCKRDSACGLVARNCARASVTVTNDDAALQKYFSYRLSCYGRNVPATVQRGSGYRRVRTGSLLAIGLIRWQGECPRSVMGTTALMPAASSRWAVIRNPSHIRIFHTQVGARERLLQSRSPNPTGRSGFLRVQRDKLASHSMSRSTT